MCNRGYICSARAFSPCRTPTWLHDFITILPSPGSNKSHPDSLTRCNRVKFFIEPEPDCDTRKVAESLAVCGRYEIVYCFHITADFDIGCIPDILFTGDALCELFHYFPIVVIIEFVRVSPYEKQWHAPGIRVFEKMRKHFKHFRMMTSWVPQEEILRQSKVSCARNCAGTDDTCCP